MLSFIKQLHFIIVMFPLSHVYMLNVLVNNELKRDLNKDDALQIAGVWLLDAIVRQPMRQAYKDSQKHFHSLEYSVADELEAGILIHVFSDNLANCGTLHFNKILQDLKLGFLASKESRLHVPHEELAKRDDFRHKLLQCGLDMIIVGKHEQMLKELFSYACDLYKQEDFQKSVFNMFVNRINNYKNRPVEFSDEFIQSQIKGACDKNLKEIAIGYQDDWAEMIKPERRARAARDAVSKEYRAVLKEAGFEVHELILENIEKNKVLDGWEADIDSACQHLARSRPDVLGLFSD